MSHLNFKKNLFDTFYNQKYCDVTFICKNDDDKWKKIRAHKLILAMASDVFEAMFYEGGGQKGAATNEEEIKVDDIKMSAMLMLLV